VVSGLITLVVPGRLVGMYLRATQRKNRDGTVVRYVQLAHNRRVDGVTQAQVLLNLGREDQLDRDGLARLVTSINRYLGTADGAAADATQLVGDGLFVTGSRPVGAVHLLDGLWRALEIDTALRKVLGSRRFTTDVERVLFALVANRAIDPMSKLCAAEWASHDVAIDGLESMDEDQAYRAMDLLVEADAQAEVQEAVFFAVANLLNLEVDLLFFDTTSTYFERDTEDSGDEAFRRYGHSKDHRDDLPQIVIGPGRHQGGHPGAGVVLARQHIRSGDPARSEGRHARLAARTRHHRRRPRILQRGQPGLPAPRRRALHRRDAHARRESAGRTSTRPPGPLPAGQREPASQGSPPRS
jgi:hypothetical protein